jgi:uncharacterized protein (DUF2225 family)
MSIQNAKEIFGMTTLRKGARICAVCGNTTEFTEVASTNTRGAMDLDTRPPEMERSTILYWVQVCPTCGYASSNISNPLVCQKEFLKSDKYKSFPLPEPINYLEKAFIWKARINENSREYSKSFLDYLYAAWVADDKNDSYWSTQA